MMADHPTKGTTTAQEMPISVDLSIPIHTATQEISIDSNPIPAVAQPIPLNLHPWDKHVLAAPETFLVPIQERVRKTTERLEADFSNKIATKIHRFPQGLRGIGGQGDRYIVPSVVAIGPYHHGSANLQEMEEVKHMAAHYFCKKSGHSVEDVYSKVLSVVGVARGCYADDAVARFSDAEFAAMMFLDGCFLLHYMSPNMQCAQLANLMTLSTGPCILRDIFLLENQLPWLVLEALWTSTYADVHNFLRRVSSFYSSSIPKGWNSVDELQSCMYKFLRRTSIFCARSMPDSPFPLPVDELQRFPHVDEYRPPHLLGFLRYHILIGMHPEDPRHELEVHAETFSSSAIELAELGIRLTASNKKWSPYMSIQKGFLTGELSLAPLFLNDHNACSLVNMAAFEACTSTSFPFDGFIICSYLSILAMLMDKEKDVHDLRAKHIVRSFFSDQEMLHFFKSISRHIRLGWRYFVIVNKIHEYQCERPVRVAVHKFLYNNFKTIAALSSIAGVLVGTFKTLMSLKKQY